MNNREKVLHTSMKRHMGKLEEFSLLASALSEWVVSLEQQHFYFEHHNWRAELITVRTGVYIGVVQCVEDKNIAFWLPLSPVKTYPYHTEAIARAVNEFSRKVTDSIGPTTA